MLMNAVKNMFKSPYNYNNVVGGQNTSYGSYYFTKLFRDTPNAYKVLSGTTGSAASQTIIDVGFGDTAVTANDLKLADGNMTFKTENTSSSSWPYKVQLQGEEYLTIVAQANNSKVDGEITDKTVVYRNDSESTVTIKEIGMYWIFNDMSYNTSTWWNTQNGSAMSLAFRKVLTTPIVMAPGDVYAVTYRISLNI